MTAKVLAVQPRAFIDVLPFALEGGCAGRLRRTSLKRVGLAIATTTQEIDIAPFFSPMFFIPFVNLPYSTVFLINTRART
jgi:hypothetical protein